MISSLDYDAIRTLVQQPVSKPLAYTFTTRNYTTDTGVRDWNANDGAYPDEESGTGWFPSSKVRLFTNDHRIRFQNIVHEIVEPSLLKTGIEVKPCTVPVHHYGRLNQEKSLAKAEEYYLMGRKKLGTDSTPNALRELAIQAGDLRKYEEALELFRQYILLKPDDHVAYCNMTTYYLELGKFTDARHAAKKAVDIVPSSQEALLGFSTASLCLGDTSGAVATLEGLLIKVPDYPPAMAVLAAAYCVNGDEGKALEILRKLTMGGYTVGVALQSLARKFIAGGRASHAIPLLHMMLKSGHLDEDTQPFLADCEAMKVAHDADRGRTVPAR